MQVINLRSITTYTIIESHWKNAIFILYDIQGKFNIPYTIYTTPVTFGGVELHVLYRRIRTVVIVLIDGYRVQIDNILYGVDRIIRYSKSFNKHNKYIIQSAGIPNVPIHTQ